MVYFSREQWQLLKKTQLVVWGNQPHALEDCLHEIRRLLKTLNYAEIGQLYADARNIFMIKIANMDGDIKTLAKAKVAGQEW